MARDQMLTPLNLGHTTGPLDGLNIVPKDTLSASCQNQRLAFGFCQSTIIANSCFDAALPFLKRRLGGRTEFLRPTHGAPRISHLVGFIANQSKDDCRECGAHSGQINTLQTVAARAQGRVLIGQEVAELPDMIFRSNLVSDLPKADIDFPADCSPVRSGTAELGRLWTFVAKRTRDPQCGNTGIEEGEDDVPGSHLAHRLVERIALVIRFSLRRPKIAALDLLPVSLILVNPPVAHAALTLLRGE